MRGLLRLRAILLAVLAVLGIAGDACGPRDAVPADARPAAAPEARRDGAPPVAILGAFGDETQPVVRAVAEPETLRVLGLRFVRGTLQGCPVVVAETGVGKVNAAATTAVLLSRFAPRAVIFTGIAGGLDPDSRPGDIVIGTATVQHDFVHATDDSLIRFAPHNPVDGSRNPVYLPADARLLETLRRAAASTEFLAVHSSSGEGPPRCVEGTIATGDAFVASARMKRELRERLGADAVEMEGAAVAQVCHQSRTPCIVIRSLSDNADNQAAEDLERFYQVAAENAARLVLSAVALMAAEPAHPR